MAKGVRERRLHQRKELKSKVIFEDEYRDSLFYLHARDISEGGLSFDVDDIPIRVGSLLFLSFSLPGYKRPMRSTGEVVRWEIKGETATAIGIRFVGLKDEFQKRIQTYVNSA